MSIQMATGLGNIFSQMLTSNVPYGKNVNELDDTVLKAAKILSVFGVKDEQVIDFINKPGVFSDPQQKHRVIDALISNMKNIVTTKGIEDAQLIGLIAGLIQPSTRSESAHGIGKMFMEHSIPSVFYHAPRIEKWKGTDYTEDQKFLGSMVKNINEYRANNPDEKLALRQTKAELKKRASPEAMAEHKAYAEAYRKHTPHKKEAVDAMELQAKGLLKEFNDTATRIKNEMKNPNPDKVAMQTAIDTLNTNMSTFFADPAVVRYMKTGVMDQVPTYSHFQPKARKTSRSTKAHKKRVYKKRVRRPKAQVQPVAQPEEQTADTNQAPGE
jgi:hypothetical protein